MTNQPRQLTYSKALMTLHWGMALLIAFAFAAIELRGYFPRGSDARSVLAMTHFLLGLTILGLVIVRLMMRAVETPPAIEPPPAHWQNALAKTVHVALYGFMLALPVLGWLLLSAQGKTGLVFGIHLPQLIGENKETASFIKEIHETLGNVLYFVIAAHAGAALLHHYGMKDSTLKRMLPARARTGSAQ